MVSNGKEYYEVRGFPIYANHSYFDPRKSGYTLFAGVLDSPSTSAKQPPKKQATGKQSGKKNRKKLGFLRKGNAGKENNRRT